MLPCVGSDEKDESGEPTGPGVGTSEAVTMVSLIELQGRTVVLGIEGIVGWLDPAPALELRTANEVDRSVFTDEVEEKPC